MTPTVIKTWISSDCFEFHMMYSRIDIEKVLRLLNETSRKVEMTKNQNPNFSIKRWVRRKRPRLERIRTPTAEKRRTIPRRKRRTRRIVQPVLTEPDKFRSQIARRVVRCCWSTRVSPCCLRFSRCKLASRIFHREVVLFFSREKKLISIDAN